jgi:hypothetical protein
MLPETWAHKTEKIALLLYPAAFTENTIGYPPDGAWVLNAKMYE